MSKTVHPGTNPSPTPQEARSLGAWRDMSSAPKDGTVIDVWRPEGGRDTVFWGFPHHECGEMGRLCDSDWHSIRAPGWVCTTFGDFLGRKHAPFTHWMPLPDPPESSVGDGATTRHEGGLRDEQNTAQRLTNGEGGGA